MQPSGVFKTASGYQYLYDLPTEGGGLRRWAVTDNTLDDVAGHGPHWEVGRVKTDKFGTYVFDNYGRYRVYNDKITVRFGDGHG